MLNVAGGTRSLAQGGVLCRPGQTGERAVWGVSDPPPETHRRPQPRPRGSLTPHVSQQVSQRFCRRRSTHLCIEISDAITMAAARACDVRSGRRSRTRRRRLLQRVPGRIVSTSHMACGAPRRQVSGSARAAPNCRPSRVTAWRCARCRARRCATLRPRVPRGLRALTAPARSPRPGSYVMAADHAAGLLVAHRLACGLTRGSARRILLLSRRCRTTPPPLRTHVHAERVCGRRSQSTTGRSLTPTCFPGVRRMRPTSDQHVLSARPRVVSLTRVA